MSLASDSNRAYVAIQNNPRPGIFIFYFICYLLNLLFYMTPHVVVFHRLEVIFTPNIIFYALSTCVIWYYLHICRHHFWNQEKQRHTGSPNGSSSQYTVKRLRYYCVSSLLLFSTPSSVPFGLTEKQEEDTDWIGYSGLYITPYFFKAIHTIDPVTIELKRRAFQDRHRTSLGMGFTDFGSDLRR